MPLSGRKIIIRMISGTLKNIESATVKIPTLLDKVESKTGEVSYKWKVNVMDTSPYWEEWFKGLSDMFNSLKVPKTLMVTSIDKLDIPLSIGHMQGKFKLDVILGTGHFIQEDKPEKVADSIKTMMELFGISNNN